MPRDTPSFTTDAPSLVAETLGSAVAASASDVHLEPTEAGYELRQRVDGLLSTTRTLSGDAGRAMVTRLMVMAELLTYRLDVPQEGRATIDGACRVTDKTGEAAWSGRNGAVECRVSVMPTIHGLRAVVRLPAASHAPHRLDELGLPAAVREAFEGFARAEQGAAIVVGPAGAGKTTTVYALLSHIVACNPGVSVVSLEDPVERAVPGITQIEVRPFGELTYERALRSMLRQDPQVLAIGEVRDPATAGLALQAALAGHRLVTTMHAASPGGAIARFLEMGVEPFRVTGAVSLIASQRLLRRRVADGGGYHGRVPVAEAATLRGTARDAVLQKADAATIDRALRADGAGGNIRQSARALIEAGVTDEAEAVRVLGPYVAG